MKNRKRLTNMLIAGTLTALLLTVFLAFRGENTAVAEASAITQTAVSVPIDVDTTDTAALQAQIESLLAQNAAYQAQNEELRTAVQTLQAREAEYRSQIEAANQTINQLSAQGNGLAVEGEGGSLFGFSRPHSHGNH